MDRHFLQLDGNNRVVAELHSSRVPGAGPDIPANFVEATNRNDGPWRGKIYNAGTDTFAPPVDPRPLAEVNTFDPTDEEETTKLEFDINEDIGISVTVKHPVTQQVVTAFNGQFAIPIMEYDPVQSMFTRTVKRLKLEFVNGVASRTISGGFDKSGDYGVDERVSNLAKVVNPVRITVAE